MKCLRRITCAVMAVSILASLSGCKKQGNSEQRLSVQANTEQTSVSTKFQENKQEISFTIDETDAETRELVHTILLALVDNDMDTVLEYAYPYTDETLEYETFLALMAWIDEVQGNSEVTEIYIEHDADDDAFLVEEFSDEYIENEYQYLGNPTEARTYDCAIRFSDGTGAGLDVYLVKISGVWYYTQSNF